jgi:endonuclease YncB( thermonuclease family)
MGAWRTGGAALAVLVVACAPADDGTDARSRPAPTATGPVTTGPDPTDVPAPDAPGPSAGVAVVGVVDGDTLDVLGADGTERLRLVGINAPEDGECLAADATRRLRRLVGAGPVVLARDVSERDQYGRLLRHVLVDGRSVGEQLVAEGLALSRAYPPDTTHQAALDAAQARAEAAGVGLWSRDACGPAATAAVDFGGVRPDPPGDESQTPNEEWVEVVNRGGRPVDLTGWGVRDESASHRYRFPDGFRLGAGSTVRLRTGCGRDSATDLHWCIAGSAVWNNDGDTAFLTDPRGNVVARRSL